MNPFIKTALAFIARPFIEKKLNEYQSSSQFDDRPHPAQTSTQAAKVGLGATMVALTQVESTESTIAAIAVLIINLYFLYKPEKK